MIRDDSFMVIRTTVKLTKPYNRPEPSEDKLGPYKCRIGRSSGSFTQAQPQGTITKTLKLYADYDVDLNEGDLIEVNGKDKYIVQNVYRPLSKHTECDLTNKKES